MLCFLCFLCMGSQALTLPHHLLSTELQLCYTQIFSAAAGEGEMETQRLRQSVALNGVN